MVAQPNEWATFLAVLAPSIAILIGAIALWIRVDAQNRVIGRNSTNIETLATRSDIHNEAINSVAKAINGELPTPITPQLPITPVEPIMKRQEII